MRNATVGLTWTASQMQGVEQRAAEWPSVKFWPQAAPHIIQHHDGQSMAQTGIPLSCYTFFCSPQSPSLRYITFWMDGCDRIHSMLELGSADHCFQKPSALTLASQKQVRKWGKLPVKWPSTKQVNSYQYADNSGACKRECLKYVQWRQ